MGQQETKFTCRGRPGGYTEFRGAASFYTGFPDQSGRIGVRGPKGNPQTTLQHTHMEQMSLCMVKHASQGACFIFHVNEY